jgi:hypothetical protein
MNARTTTGLVATLLLLAGCSSDHDDVVKDDAPVSAPTVADEAVSTDSPLAGTYATDPIPVTRMVDVARQAGFEEKDVAEFRDSYAGVQQVVFTLELTDDQWVVFESRDGGTASDDWAGPYEVLDDTTVRAGTPPCGPITYEYSLVGDELSLDLTDDACRDGSDQDSAPAGELIAQTTIYESAPYHRIA